MHFRIMHNGHPLLFTCDRYALSYSIYFGFFNIEGIKPDGRINKKAVLQGTKFLRLFDLTNVHY
jgi:hypothetical protein